MPRPLRPSSASRSGFGPWLGLCLVLLTQACGGADGEAQPETGAIRVQDAAGRTLTLQGPVRRVVSLVPSATLTLDAIGARDVLVGRTDFDTASWLSELPSVGGGINPSYETLVSLAPDLVIRFAGEQDAETPEVLDRMGIRHLAVRPDGIDDVRASIHLLGAVTGHEEEAGALVERIDASLEAVRSTYAGRVPVRAVYVLGGTPPWVAGPGTYVHEILEIAGAVNVFGDLERLYAPVSPEELVVREIDVVLTPEATAVPSWLAERAEVREVGDLLELPGPGVADAARAVARILHGETPP